MRMRRLKLHQNQRNKISRMRVHCQNLKLRQKTSLIKKLRVSKRLLKRLLKMVLRRIFNKEKLRTVMIILLQAKKNKKAKMEQKIALKTLLRMESVRRFLKMYKELRLKVKLALKRLQMKIVLTILQNKNHNLIVNLIHQQRKAKTNYHQRLINRKLHRIFSQISSR